MNVAVGGGGGRSAARAPLVGLLLDADAPRAKFVPAALARAAAAPIATRDFAGKELETALVYDGKQRILLVGLGERKSVTAETLRRAGAAIVRRARQLKLEQCGVMLASGVVAPAEAGRALAEGAALGNYVFHGQKSEAPPARARRVTIDFAGSAKERRAFAAGLADGATIGRAQCLARDLGNHPSNVATPRFLVEQARKTVRGSRVRLKVVARKELARRGFGGLLGVSRGSAEPPFFLEFDWRPARWRKSICLIGKAVTFDTGGISLKPAQGMEEMKFDLCGGAAVIATFAAITELKPNVRVFGLVPCTENMPGGRAIKPGDVLKTYGGLTVEVTNTDAEGRLLLADALGRAQELEPDFAVDLATLTGACVVALGHKASGLFCNHADLADRLKRAGDEAGERLWPLPLWDDYLDEMRSTVADLKNSGSRFGGAATAAAFLRKFAGELPWAHLDIAGTAWDVPRNELYDGGASGVGVRMLVRLLEGLE
jgi:leucyl aminopeptidase